MMIERSCAAEEGVDRLDIRGSGSFSHAASSRTTDDSSVPGPSRFRPISQPEKRAPQRFSSLSVLLFAARDDAVWSSLKHLSRRAACTANGWHPLFGFSHLYATLFPFSLLIHVLKTSSTSPLQHTIISYSDPNRTIISWRSMFLHHPRDPRRT